MSPLAYIVAAAVLVTAGGGLLIAAIRARRARAALVEATERLGASAQRLHEDANRLPSPAEIEALAEALHDDTSAEMESMFNNKPPKWRDTLESEREAFRIYARAAWKRGAR